MPKTAPEAASFRPIVVLSAAAFASAATLRVADPLIPQLAAEFGTTPGGASAVATAFALSYGLCQILVGPLGDRFGKYRIVVFATLLSGVTAGAAALAHSLAMVGVLRFVSGATTGAIIPLSMAFIGDVIVYEQRQTVLARFLSGQILGVIFGQIFGGVFGDSLGWRGVFVALALVYAVIATLLWVELRSPRVAEARAAESSRGMLVRYLGLCQSKPVRIIVGTAFIEAFFFFGGFVYLGAYLRQTFALSYLAVGGLLATFGIGGLLYAAAVKPLVARLGERGLALAGGVALAGGFALAAMAPTAGLFAPIIATIGAGFYMLHNTLQTHATQMAPHARALAISTFAFCYFMGQAAGVWTCGIAVDALGYAPVFIMSSIGLLVLALAFRATLPKPAPPA